LRIVTADILEGIDELLSVNRHPRTPSEMIATVRCVCYKREVMAMPLRRIAAGMSAATKRIPFE
jgi:hypothetical protein